MGSHFHYYCTNLDILSSSRLRFLMDLAGDPLRAPLSMAHMRYNTQNQYHHIHHLLDGTRMIYFGTCCSIHDDICGMGSSVEGESSVLNPGVRDRKKYLLSTSPIPISSYFPGLKFPYILVLGASKRGIEKKCPVKACRMKIQPTITPHSLT